jgi:glycerol-3-phosphate acyltransferase PlsY
MISGSYSIPHGIAAIILPAVIIYAHRSNIVRLMNGTERKIGEKK